MTAQAKMEVMVGDVLSSDQRNRSSNTRGSREGWKLQRRDPTSPYERVNRCLHAETKNEVVQCQDASFLYERDRSVCNGFEKNTSVQGFSWFDDHEITVRSRTSPSPSMKPCSRPAAIH